MHANSFNLDKEIDDSPEFQEALAEELKKQRVGTTSQEQSNPVITRLSDVTPQPVR